MTAAECEHYREGRFDPSCPHCRAGQVFTLLGMEIATHGLNPLQVVAAWLLMLTEAGRTGVQVASFRNAEETPRVVEFDCPHWHEGLREGTLAKVRLLIDPRGRFRRYPGYDDGDGGEFDERRYRPGTGCCPECSLASLVSWFLTCPACSSGEHEPHPGRWRWEGNRSPASVLLRIIPTKPTPRKSSTRTRKAGARKAPARPRPTLADARALLDKHGVPPETGQNQAWLLVASEARAAGISQALVRAAQKARKAGGTTS